MTAAPSFLVAAFVLVVFSRPPSAAAQPADQLQSCPLPFPSEAVSDRGQCRCSTDGQAYTCLSLNNWYRPASASDVNKITRFSVDRGMFSSTVIPRYFLTSYAPNVGEFRCTSSGITAVEPYAFANVSSLKTIVLDGNRIRKLTALSFAGLRELAKISLQNAGIAVISPDAFLNMNGVGHLDVSRNGDLVVEPNAFRNVAFIDQLDLRDHGMRQLNSSFLAGLSSVRNLVLSSVNGIDELIAGALSGVSDIRTIEIVSSRLRRVQPGAFVGAVRVGTVQLMGNAVVTVENGSLDGDVGAVDWRNNDFTCDRRLAWIFGKGGLGDGLNETLLMNMQCERPSEFVYTPVVELREEFRRRGYLDQPSAETTAAVLPTVAVDGTIAPSGSTVSLLRRLLPQYVARMNSTKNRPRSGAARRAPALAAVVLVASSLLVAMPDMCDR